MSSASGSVEPPPETQYVSQSGDSENMWEVKCILDERGPRATGEYLLQWEGVDPQTGEPWGPTWEAKEGCSTELIREWKDKIRKDPLIVGKAGAELAQAKLGKRKRGYKKNGKKPVKGDKGEGGKEEEQAEKRTKSRSTRMPTGEHRCWISVEG
jgi:hypothetical protein